MTKSILFDGHEFSIQTIIFFTVPRWRWGRAGTRAYSSSPGPAQRHRRRLHQSHAFSSCAADTEGGTQSQNGPTTDRISTLVPGPSRQALLFLVQKYRNSIFLEQTSLDIKASSVIRGILRRLRVETFKFRFQIVKMSTSFSMGRIFENFRSTV